MRRLECETAAETNNTTVLRCRYRVYVYLRFGMINVQCSQPSRRHARSMYYYYCRFCLFVVRVVTCVTLFRLMLLLLLYKQYLCSFRFMRFGTRRARRASHNLPYTCCYQQCIQRAGRCDIMHQVPGRIVDTYDTYSSIGYGTGVPSDKGGQVTPS